jgi:starch phosphorylase
MVQDYDRDFYRPAAEAYTHLTANGAARARELVESKAKLDANFSNGRMSISVPEVLDSTLEDMHVGDKFKVRVRVNLADLTPGDVEVDAYYGTVDAHNDMIASSCEPMTMIENQGDGNYIYLCTVECRQAGRFGLTARIKAGGTDWDNSIPSFMCWPVQG